VKRKALRACVKEIRELQGDIEGAHSRLDDLYESVLQAIAKGDVKSLGHAQWLAREAVAAGELVPERWCG